MQPRRDKIVESQNTSEFARIMRPGHGLRSILPAGRLNLQPEEMKNGLARLVLVLIKLLHKLLERQAIRRMETGSLAEVDVERLGMTLMRQAQEIERLRELFGLKEEDMNIDLGPLGKLL